MFDPTQPANNSALSSPVMRGQLNGLKDLIDALNVILSATVDGVNTINFGDPATATANLVGNVLHFSFDIPRGGVGAPGQDGIPGQQGPPFAQAIIDAVNTLDPSQQATVSVNFDGNNVRFTFGIPRGNDGGQGGQGEQGPPGEVTNSALANAISNALTQTSSNSNAVSTISTNAPASYEQSQIQELIDKMNELIAALRK